MTVLVRGLIFQPVLASLPYTHTIHAHNYNDDTIITSQNILTVQISIKMIFRKTLRYKKTF